MDSKALPIFESHLMDALNPLPDETRRLFHGRGCCWTGLEHIAADWLQGILLISLFKEPDEPFLSELHALLERIAGQPLFTDNPDYAIQLHHRSRTGCPIETCHGTPERFHVIQESGLSYKLDMSSKQNNGLFLDMRLGRDKVRALSAGKSVLNLFSYTCGFSVAAIAGGARSVINLDMSSPALSRGRENHKLNQHDLSKVSFLAHDLFKSWGKVRKKGPYDIIIVDPPSFQKGSFILSKDYPRVMRRLPDLLTDNGIVLLCANEPTVTTAYLTEQIRTEAPDLAFQYRLENPAEFKDIDEEKALKVLVFRKE